MNSAKTYIKDKITAKRLCNEFIEVYVSLKDLRCLSESDTNYRKCSEFLNYWVNFKFRKSMINDDDCVSDVHNAIESHMMSNNFYDTYLNFIYDINKDDLNKMNLLYSLYKKYKVIDGILENADNMVKKTLLSHSNACCKDYLEAKNMCNGGNDDHNNNSQFCTQLQKFETTYEGLYSRVHSKGLDYTNNFKRLTQCNNNTMSTALIGTTVGVVPLLVGLYKFTPLGQLFNPNKRKFTQEYRSNDDMTNIMLMDKESERISSQQGRYNIKYHSV
ncbi:hypothetical protein PVBG_03686 [Plasmodium vivax Brazil I]|uniref:VIR protein n=1 Tax=Plasmodium vivax (strain Brazil I) TaxID=1033975 RepID=A0A0J9T2U1_PLAV1|nr:hypothetical protein PVBG_03686 [Plasmodium vivax Brazil I]